MSEPSLDAVYAKTPQGSDEVATRRHGLAMRLRQLLILVDGRRSIADLAKLVPGKDLAAQLVLLEGQGFVARADAPPAGVPAAARAPAATAGGAAHGTHAPPAQAPLGLIAGARLAPSTPGDPGPAAQQGPVPRPADAASHAGGPDTRMRAAAALPQRRDLETVRRAIVRHLVDAIGPHADDLAVRVERCRSVDELRQILPSAAGLVEAIRGRAAMAEFVQRVGDL